ncbi:hypothetical protein [Terasakiella sp. SH-1]|uniref:hypothetical protein n=1 Tax=Terasakiella sp. SH-1 TaxID=2560057 RepID=UPI001073C6BE|nr:hypothetical protein [Terasakiella sp. SH-1]
MLDVIEDEKQVGCTFVSDYYAQAYELQELFASYTEESPDFSQHQKRKYLKTIVDQARSYLENQKCVIAKELNYRAKCMKAVDTANGAIEVLEYLVSYEPSTTALETSVKQWYFETFLAGQKSCACCDLNSVWLKG